MAFIHISAVKGRSIEDFRVVSARHNKPQDIDGLLAWAAGSDENGLHVVSVWESKAHQERWAAEQLFPAFQSLGMTDVPGRWRVHRNRGRRAGISAEALYPGFMALSVPRPPGLCGGRGTAFRFGMDDCLAPRLV